MNILYLANDMSLSGSPMGITTEAIELKKRGHHVIICSVGGPLVQKLNNHGIPHFQLDLPHFGLHKKVDKQLDKTINFLRNVAKAIRRNRIIKCYKALSYIIEKERIEVIYSHQPGPTLLAFLINRFKRLPYCIRVQHIFSNEYPPMFVKYAQKNCTAISVITKEIEDYILTTFEAPKEKIFKIPTPVELSNNSSYTEIPLELEHLIKSTNPLILTISTLIDDKVKPIEALIDAASNICTELPNAKILIVGNGPNLERLRDRAKEINRALNRTVVILPGGSNDVRPFLKAADVVLGVGRVAMEALSMGKLLICSSHTGFGGLFELENASEISDYNFSGRNFTKQVTSQRISKEILKLFTKPNDERESLRRFGLKFFTERYSIEIQIKQTENLLEFCRKKKTNGEKHVYKTEFEYK